MARKPKTIEVELVTDDFAERMVRILGDSCAMAHALKDREQRRAAGEDPVIVSTGASVLVVPRDALGGADCAR